MVVLWRTGGGSAANFLQTDPAIPAAPPGGGPAPLHSEHDGHREPCDCGEIGEFCAFVTSSSQLGPCVSRIDPKTLDIASAILIQTQVIRYLVGRKAVT